MSIFQEPSIAIITIFTC